ELDARSKVSGARERDLHRATGEARKTPAEYGGPDGWLRGDVEAPGEREPERGDEYGRFAADLQVAEHASRCDGASKAGRLDLASGGEARPPLAIGPPVRTRDVGGCRSRRLRLPGADGRR